MVECWSRRDFLRSAAGGLGASTVMGIPHPLRPPRPLPPESRWAAKPVAIASANGLRAVQKAFDLLMQGADTLDAVVEGVKIQELDPNDDSVGYGGLPNAEGVVQLDASCMHGPTKRAGAVGALENIKTPSEVAKLILKYTTHIFLVGEGAKRFALSFGFKEEDLLTEHSRETWLRWRANLSPTDNYLDVPDSDHLVVTKTGTINCDAVTPQGDLSSVTTTSGLSWKIPGRVGDSPIIGAGQYCDNAIGAAGSTPRSATRPTYSRARKSSASRAGVPTRRAGRAKSEAPLGRSPLSVLLLQLDRRILVRRALRLVQPHGLRRACRAQLRPRRLRCRREHAGQLHGHRRRAGAGVLGGLEARRDAEPEPRQSPRLLRTGQQHHLRPRQRRRQPVILLPGEPHDTLGAAHGAAQGGRATACAGGWDCRAHRVPPTPGDQHLPTRQRRPFQ